ncbi:MAG TPA: hypothetical protein VJH20_00325 [Candidatus Nanoarchaeia archaeon]|nr:hypothetical protein [Candidatus Nanoarchaeia archaeon]
MAEALDTLVLTPGKARLDAAIENLADCGFDLMVINILITSFPDNPSELVDCYLGSTTYDHDLHCGKIAGYLDSLTSEQLALIISGRQYPT